MATNVDSLRSLYFPRSWSRRLCDPDDEEDAENNDVCDSYDEDSFCFFVVMVIYAQHLWCEPSDKRRKGCIASLGDEFTSYKNHLQAEIRSYKNHLEFKQKLEATKTTFKLKLI